ncbi:hypothetical protein Q3G72_009762 [Acer saccharum]|nr:hypothetical protein Q3G72_009762 [Acer saccharum]
MQIASLQFGLELLAPQKEYLWASVEEIIETGETIEVLEVTNQIMGIIDATTITREVKRPCSKEPPPVIGKHLQVTVGSVSGGMELSGSKLGSGGTPQHQALMVEQVLGEDSHQALMEEDILREEEIGCNSGSAETTRDEVIINVPMGSTGPTQQDFQAQREVVTNNRDSSGLLSELPNIRSTSHQAQTKEVITNITQNLGSWKRVRRGNTNVKKVMNLGEKLGKRKIED